MSASAPPRKGAPPGKAAGKGKAPAPPTGGRAPPPPKNAGAPPGRRPPAEALGPRLRPLFWTSVAQVSPESVFANLGDPAPFDTSRLEQQFVLTESRSGASTKREISEPEQRKRLRVLDDKTSQLLAIVFNRLPPPDQVASMVDSLDAFPEGLPSEAVLAMNNAMVEHKEAVDQIRQLAAAEADIALLDLPERYLWVLAAVPSGVAKLNCGALIVGSACELGDLRKAGEKVGVCCQALQRSVLLRKCISTSYAVGNILNRGTARAGVAGLVLPESLLMFDQLRCTNAADSDSGTLLDFVAQALAEEAGASEAVDSLISEVEDLLLKSRAAQTVCLAETEAHCRRVCNEVNVAKTGLAAATPSPGVSRINEKVLTIYEEAEFAQSLVALAKKQLAKTQAWSNTKGTPKSNDWFGSWATYFEQLGRALQTVQARQQKQLSRPASAKSLNSVQDACMTDVAAEAGAKRDPPLARPRSDTAPAAVSVAAPLREPLKPKAEVKLYDDNVTIDMLRASQKLPQNSAPQKQPEQATTLFNAWTKTPASGEQASSKENRASRAQHAMDQIL